MNIEKHRNECFTEDPSININKNTRRKKPQKEQQTLITDIGSQYHT